MRSSNPSFTRCLEAIGERVEEFCCSEVGQHLIDSHKELLLALRAALDHKIERLDELTKPTEPREVEVQ